MCSSSPKIPDPPPPPEPAKQPDSALLKERSKANRTGASMGAGSLLTGPSGVGAVSTGKTSLLGG